MGVLWLKLKSTGYLDLGTWGLWGMGGRMGGFWWDIQFGRLLGEKCLLSLRLGGEKHSGGHRVF